MRLNKKSTAVCSIAVGAAILATSAFADVMLGSGYNSFKTAAKTTAAKLTEEIDNFTLEVSASIKVDDTAYVEGNETIKYDIANQAQESIGRNSEGGNSNDTYIYSDKKQRIHYDSRDGVYYVYDINRDSKDDGILNNPFKEEQAEDAEKILDAFVGNLQDIVQVEESDGKKMYMGSLTDTQVPPLVNAVSSYIMKYAIFNDIRSGDINIPYPKTNIYVVEASGKAVENEDGILTSVIAKGSISGTDKDGTQHLYTAEFSFEVKDINSTVVKKPDLSGQKVEYGKDDSGSDFDEKYIGVYKSDIVEQEGNRFVKKGERIFEITAVGEDTISGRYYEVCNDAGKAATAFEFSSEKSDEYGTVKFKYNQDGEEKTGIIYRSTPPDINIELDVIINPNGKGWSSHNRSINFNGNFVRVFE